MMKRHIGRNANTQQRYVVVLLQIPERIDHALVVQMDVIPPRFEQTLMSVVESHEGQNEAQLANVLGRRIYQDTGKSILQTLHEQGYLSPIHIDLVTMLPQPNMPIPLRTILDQIGAPIPISDTQPIQEPQKFNPIINNMAAASDENRLAIANNLMMQASDLQAEADRKRTEAYAYAPELRPSVAVAPPVAAVAPPLTEEVAKPKARAPRAKPATGN